MRTSRQWNRWWSDCNATLYKSFCYQIDSLVIDVLFIKLGGNVFVWGVNPVMYKILQIAYIDQYRKCESYRSVHYKHIFLTNDGLIYFVDNSTRKMIGRIVREESQKIIPSIDLALIWYLNSIIRMTYTIDVFYDKHYVLII